MTAAQRTEASAWRPAYLGIFGGFSGGSVSSAERLDRNVLRCVLNWVYFQVSSGCDAAGNPPAGIPRHYHGHLYLLRIRSCRIGGGCGGGGGPITTGAENCIAVCLRIRTTKSRISTHRARRDAASLALSLRDAGRRQRLPHGLQLGDRDQLLASGCGEGATFSPRIPQINGKYFGRDLLVAPPYW